MHPIQERLLLLARRRDLGQLSLRAIGGLIGEPHPQKVKFHLEKLIAAGFLKSDIDRKSIARVPSKRSEPKHSELLSIPILGNANAGPAHIYADQDLAGYLRISSGLLPVDSNFRKIFAIKVSGDSMNRARVRDAKTIEEGDFILVDSTKQNPKSGDYVLSVIDGAANIKRYMKDEINNQVILISESSKDYAPIYIHNEDQSSYRINGIVVDVLKKPKV